MSEPFNQRKAVRAVFGASLRPSEKLVLLCVIDHWSKRFPVPFPGLATLATETGQQRRTVIDAVRSLVARGVLPDPVTRDADGKPRAGVPHRYQIEIAVSRLVSNLHHPPVSNLHRSAGEPPVSDSHGDRYPIRTPGGASHDTDQHQNGSHSPEEITEESSEEIKLPRRRAAGSGPALVLEAPKPRKKTLKPKKPKRTRTDSEVASHREILDAYTAAVLAKTGSAPSIGSREAASAWKLLDWCKGDGTRAVALVRGAVGRDFGGSTSLNVIASDPNKFLGSTKPTTRTSGPKQPNAGLWKPPVENL